MENFQQYGYQFPATAYPPGQNYESTLFQSGSVNQENPLIALLNKKFPGFNLKNALPNSTYRTTDSGIEIERKDPYTPIDD